MGCHASTKGHEGDEGWQEGNDSDCCLQVGGRGEEFEDERCEGHRCGVPGGCIHGGEEDGLLQACRHAQDEAEGEDGDESAQRYQPLHQGALRLQGEARLEDCEMLCHEEAQGLAELRALLQLSRERVVAEVILMPWWADSPGSGAGGRARLTV